MSAQLSNSEVAPATAELVDGAWGGSDVWTALVAGNLSKVEAFALQRLSEQPADARAFELLGLSAAQRQDWGKAIPALQSAVDESPQDASFLNNLGLALRLSGQPVAAKRTFERALHCSPESPDTQLNLGLLAHDHGDWSAAERHFIEALRFDPCKLSARYNLGIVLKERGKFEQAAACWREVVNQQPHHALAWAEIAKIQGRQLSASDSKAIKGILLQDDLPLTDAAALQLAWAHVLDQRGEYLAAVALSISGNTSRLVERLHRGQAYDRTQHTAQVSELIKQIEPVGLARLCQLPNTTTGPRLIFIVGMPRSGTTLLEQILTGHPSVRSVGERAWFSEIAAAGWPAFVKLLQQSEVAGLNAARLLNSWRQQYYDRITEAGETGQVILDKTPENYLALPLLQVLFPDATVIYCRRQPRDLALSCWMTDFTEIPWSNSPEDIIQRIRDAERLMQRWQEVLPIPIDSVDYESLVHDPAVVGARVARACGLEWQDEFLQFSHRPQPIKTASTLQARRPIYQSSVGRWRHYAPHLAALFESLPDSSTTVVAPR